MAANQVRINGLDRLQRTLKAAGTSIEDLKALNAEVGQVVAAGAEPLVAHLTGALAGSIRSSGTKRAAVIRAGGARVPYAGVQEFGWPARNIPPHPGLTASLANNEDEVMAMYQSKVDEELGKVRGI